MLPGVFFLWKISVLSTSTCITSGSIPGRESRHANKTLPSYSLLFKNCRTGKRPSSLPEILTVKNIRSPCKCCYPTALHWPPTLLRKKSAHTTSILNLMKKSRSITAVLSFILHARRRIPLTIFSCKMPYANALSPYRTRKRWTPPTTALSMRISKFRSLFFLIKSSINRCRFYL